jgi:hypothetical protein
VENDASEFSVFPNPAAGGLFNVNVRTWPAEITIRAITGREVLRTSAQSELTTIQLNQCEGLYIIEVVQNRKTSYKKIFVN